VDFEIFMTSFLVPFISSWNGTASLLQDLGVAASAHDLDDYKVHRDVFPQAVMIWCVTVLVYVSTPLVQLTYPWCYCRERLVKSASTPAELVATTSSLAQLWWQRGLERRAMSLDEMVASADEAIRSNTRMMVERS